MRSTRNRVYRFGSSAPCYWERLSGAFVPCQSFVSRELSLRGVMEVRGAPAACRRRRLRASLHCTVRALG